MLQEHEEIKNGKFEIWKSGKIKEFYTFVGQYEKYHLTDWVTMCLKLHYFLLFLAWLHSIAIPPPHLLHPRPCSRPVGCDVNWLFNVTINDISVIYVTAHRCAGPPKKKLDLRSGSQCHRHYVGFFNVPVQTPTRDPLFIRWFQHTAPFSRLLRHVGDTEDVFWS